MKHQKIAVALRWDEGVSRRARVPAPNPSRWTEEDARVFVRSVWDLLEAHDAESLQMSEVQPWASYRLEFVADRGRATSEPLALSRRAFGWLRSSLFAPDLASVN